MIRRHSSSYCGLQVVADDDVVTNVSPSFLDGGTWERGNSHSGRVETTPEFRDIRGGRGDVSKIIKIK